MDAWPASERDREPRRGVRSIRAIASSPIRSSGLRRSVRQKTIVPSYKDLLWPTLRAVTEIGDSGTIEEIVEKVLELEGFSEE